MQTIKRKLHTLFHTPRILMIIFASTPFFSLLSDKCALKILYKNTFLKKLDLKNPQTFNEKLQWLKLYDRRPEYTTMVDKYAAKQYAASIIGEEHIIPTYGVWDSFDEIDFDKLPRQFVLKCTHGSGDVVICRDKSTFDKSVAREKLTKSLNTNYYKISREWPYKNVPRRIIAEKYMCDSSDPSGLVDYKMMCFNGNVKCTFVCKNRTSGSDMTITIYDADWNRLDMKRKRNVLEKDMEKSVTYEEMKELAEKLSESIPFGRIDFYEIDHQVWWGEITLYPAVGMEHFYPDSWDKTLGDWITLPENRGGVLTVQDNLHIWIHEETESGNDKTINPQGINDYKFFCFDGEPKIMFVASDRAADCRFDYFDMDFVHLPIYNIHLNSEKPIKKPAHFEEMKELVKQLSKGYPFVRVDLYEISGMLYFGEFTLYHAGGFSVYEPEEWDYKIGEWLHLPTKTTEVK